MPPMSTTTQSHTPFRVVSDFQPTGRGIQGREMVVLQLPQE